MDQELILRKLEGMQTVETAAEKLGLAKGTVNNILSRLQRERYATIYLGGGKNKRIYLITLRKQRERQKGMWDIINEHSPMKLAPWYDHQVHGQYGAEEALIDALETGSFRIILASMHLFKAITRWQTLYGLAKERNIWQKVGALYDVARLHMRVRRMPSLYHKPTGQPRVSLIKDYSTTEEMFKPITEYWNVDIPFRRGDIEKVIYDNT